MFKKLFFVLCLWITTMPLFGIYKNQAGQKIAIFAWDSLTSAAKTGDAANITARISLDGAAVAQTDDDNPTELNSTYANGIYIFNLTQAETNANFIVLNAKSSTSGVIIDPVICWTQDPNVAAVLAIVNHTDYGNAHLVRSATPANTITVDTHGRIDSNNTNSTATYNIVKPSGTGDLAKINADVNNIETKVIAAYSSGKFKVVDANGNNVAAAATQVLNTHLTDEIIGRIDNTISSRLADVNYTAPDNTTITAINDVVKSGGTGDPNAQWTLTKAILEDTSAYDTDAEHAAAIWNAATASYGTSGSYGLLIETDLDAAISSRQETITWPPNFSDFHIYPDGSIVVSTLSDANHPDPNNTGIAAIQEKTDALPASPAAVGSAMTLADSAITSVKFDGSTAFPQSGDVFAKMPSTGRVVTDANLTGTIIGHITSIFNKLPIGFITSDSNEPTWPANFADLAITSSTGRISVGTNYDKTGYSISGTKQTLDALNDLSVSDVNISVGALSFDPNTDPVIVKFTLPTGDPNSWTGDQMMYWLYSRFAYKYEKDRVSSKIYINDANETRISVQDYSVTSSAETIETIEEP